MKFHNPTQLRLGMMGSFFNRTYRLAGRAVLGIIEDGQNYYWNEFYLESGGGEMATLVFEETETGAAWRLFTMFEPQPPMTAAEAAAKRVGDPVELDGARLFVNRVDRSQVYYVEGKAPEGIERGKVAHYFNAQTGSREVVVSWTGDEVEFYSGSDTSAPMVASAFKLQGFAAWRFMASKGRTWWSGRIWVPAALALALIGIPIGCYIDMSRSRPAPAVTFVQAPSDSLRFGATGELNNIPYTITGHELVEMAEPGRRWHRQQYDLISPDNLQARLVCDAGSNGPVWFLCASLQPANPLTPLEAGAKRASQKIDLDGSELRVKELFRSTVISSEGGAKAGEELYGFAAPINSNEVLLVRWNQTNIIYEKSAPVPARTVLKAFGQTAGDRAPR